MRATSLVLVEGFPGSGKSTTASYLARLFEAADVPVVRYLEDQPNHPLNVGGPLHPSGSTTGEVFFARYTVDSFIEESLTRWRGFVAAADGWPGVSVVESYPVQSSARVLMQLDAPLDRIRGYARQVETLIAPLTPVLIFLDAPDNLETVQAASLLRGEDWTAYAIAVITTCPYAWRRQLTGRAGAMEILKAYQTVTTQLLDDSQFPRLVLSSCHGQWESCYDRMMAFLDLAT